MRALLTSFLLVIVALVRGATVTDLVQNAAMRIPTNAALVFTPISAPLWVEGVLTTGEPQGTRVDRYGRISIDLAGGYYSLQIGTNSRRFTVGVPPGTGTYQLAQLVSNTIAFLTNIPPALYEVRTNKGIANGYASLGADGLVPAEQLPEGLGGGTGDVTSIQLNAAIAYTLGVSNVAANGLASIQGSTNSFAKIPAVAFLTNWTAALSNLTYTLGAANSNLAYAIGFAASNYAAAQAAVKLGTNNSTHFGYLRLPRTNDYIDFNQTWNVRRYPDDTLHFDYPDVAATPLLIRPNGITVSNIYIPGTNVFIQWNGTWSLVAWADGSFRLLNDDTGTTPFSVATDGTVTAPAFVGDGSGLTGLPGGAGGSANVIADSAGRGTNTTIVDGLTSTNSALGSDPLTHVSGFHAGLGATSSVMSAWVGHSAGAGVSNAPESTFFGYNAGAGLHDGQAVTAIGWTAAQNMRRSSSAIAIGYQAMEGADLMPSAIAIGVHNSQGAADSVGMVNIGYYANGNNSAYSISLGYKGGWGSPYRWWMDGYRAAIGEEYKPMFDAYFLDRWFQLRGRQIISNTNEAATGVSLSIQATGTNAFISASVGSIGAQVEKFSVSSNGNVTASGTFYGNGAGITNVAVSDIVSNIVISDTNAVIINFAAANEFGLTILTNFNLIYSNVALLKRLGFIHFVMGTNGGFQLQSAQVTGGVLRTNANQQPTTNANAYDILEVKRDINLTNLSTWWPQNFQPRVPTDKHLGSSEFVVSTTGGSQDFNNNSGFKFTVGASDLSVTDIGMFADSVDPSSAVTVAIKSADCATVIASASVDTSAHDAAYHYTGITPVTLTAGTSYNIIWTSGATVFNYGISVFTTSGGTIISDNYNGCNNPLFGAGATCRGPNFKYQ